MKSTILYITLLAIAVVGFSSIYIVDEKEQVIVLQFGKPVTGTISDAGLYFKIPFNSFVGGNTKGKFATLLRSIQRDGGQKLEDFTGRLWHDLRSVRYDSFERNKPRMIPK